MFHWGDLSLCMCDVLCHCQPQCVPLGCWSQFVHVQWSVIKCQSQCVPLEGLTLSIHFHHQQAGRYMGLPPTHRQPDQKCFQSFFFLFFSLFSFLTRPVQYQILCTEYSLNTPSKVLLHIVLSLFHCANDHQRSQQLTKPDVDPDIITI